MPPIHEKTVCFRKLVNVHPETRGKALGIPFGKINKSGLAAAGAASPALEG
jgi:hypothetical protein